jgi:hypothetical protein
MRTLKVSICILKFSNYTRMKYRLFVYACWSISQLRTFFTLSRKYNKG